VDAIGEPIATQPQWTLTGPGGVVVMAKEPRYDDANNLFTLPSAGTYTLVVSATDDGVGPYSFRITQPTTQTFAYTLGTTISNGVPAAGAGNIELPRNADHYTFTATAGQVVNADVLAFTLCGEQVWSITGPGGTAMTERNLCADPGNVTLPSAGTYTIRVSSTTDATGTYSVKVT
jgi:hypothetical protein